MKSKRSSLPTFGSAIGWEVVGIVFGTAFGTVIGIISSVLFISLSFLILVVSLQLSCGYQSVNCRDITSAWVGHGQQSFSSQSLLQISSYRHRRAGSSLKFSHMIWCIIFKIVMNYAESWWSISDQTLRESATHEPTKQTCAVVNILGNIITIV